ncbi:unnamed protein product [Rotaria magnacalcarata]|uniref:Uncharacterized protein n=1 Tax=Rotaria magnacalcarata TaxID=392030 RepID=A0A816V7X0_9BILA|nr:unnamed protein product [Rotaria magnacalcarata]
MTSPGHKIKVTRIHKLSTSHELLTTSNKSIQEQPKNQNLNNKDMENDPSINLRSRRYSSVHIQRINRPSANKSNASLPSNDLTQTTYLPFDLQITHSSLSKKKNLIQCSIKSDQRNPLPNYFDKIISPTEYVKARSQSLSEEKRFPSSVRVQRIIRTPTYVKQIHIPFNDHYRSQISAPDEIRSAPNKLNDLFYIPQHDLSTSISSTRTILPRNEDVIIRDEEPRLFTFYWILGVNDKKKRRRRGAYFTSQCCCCTAMTLFCSILLAALLAAIILLTMTTSTTSTTTSSTTTTTTSTTTTETSTKKTPISLNRSNDTSS